MLKFGDKFLQSRVLLAPMAGVTDFPLRRIIRKFGPFLMFSEMIASQAVIRNVKKTFKMMEGTDSDKFTAVQIAGADPYAMAEATKLSCDLGAPFIDINMGCPVKKVVKSESGAALMQNEKLAASIIEAVVKSSSVPVSLKMRLGWNSENKNAPSIARMAEQIGVSLITVHGRTRSQFYNGSADWKSVALVKLALQKIPLIVNGDITSIETASSALRESQADGVMIGRGALGNPWLLQEIHNFIENDNLKTYCSKKEVLKKHIDYMFEFYPEDVAVKLCRKILAGYFKNIPNAAQYRLKSISVSSVQEVYEILTLKF